MGNMEALRMRDMVTAENWGVPLRAFKANGVVIEPENYRRELEGALCWVEFYLEHRVRGGQQRFFRGTVTRIHKLEGSVEEEEALPFHQDPLNGSDGIALPGFN